MTARSVRSTSTSTSRRRTRTSPPSGSRRSPRATAAPCNWKAILLGATFQAAELKSPVAYPLKREYTLLDFERSARFAGVPLKMPREVSDPDAERRAPVLVAAAARRPRPRASWARHCLRAFFARGVDLSDPAALKALCAEFGLDRREAEAIWSDPEWKARLKAANDAAIAARRVRRAVLRRSTASRSGATTGARRSSAGSRRGRFERRASGR